MKQRLGSKTGRALLGLMLACAMLVGLVAPAGAISPLPITCTAAGIVNTVSGQPDLWSISGQGSCQGDLEGTYVLSFTGVGISSGLGLCPSAPGNLLVTDFGMIVTGTMTNLATGIPKALAQTWSAPITTYPIATPFLIDATSMGDGFGAGSMFNHIFLNCSGTPVAQFTFSWLT